MSKIRHSLEELKQPVTVVLKGCYEWENGWEEVAYHRVMIERKTPEDMMELLLLTNTKIGDLARMAGAVALPLPIQELALEREQLDIKVLKIGKGVYERLDQIGLPTTKFELKFRAQFPEAISFAFGTHAPASTMEISQRLRSITAS
jgi:hypothetical protein